MFAARSSDSVDRPASNSWDLTSDLYFPFEHYNAVSSAPQLCLLD